VTTESKVEAGALPAGWVMRTVTMEDIDRAVELMNARSRRFYGEDQITREEVAAWWRSARFDLAKDCRMVLDARGELAGIANIGNPGEPYAEISCAGITHPSYEGLGGLWDRLHAWSISRARELIPLAAEGIRVTAMSNIAGQDTARAAALERAGFAAVRLANHMGITLESLIPEAQWPAGISVRAVDIERDLEAIVRLVLETWRDHWGFVAQPFDQALADWKEGVSALGDKFDPTLWFLAMDGSEIAGISLCDNRIVDDTTRGYIDSLGVRPAWRKRGIALALLRHTFGEFARRGYAAVELDMDSENLTGALRVYERAGMHVIRQSVWYEKELRAGTDLATRTLAV